MGGLARKASFTASARKDASGRTFLLVDSGDLLFPEEPLEPDEVQQRQVKAELILDANKAMGIDAVGIGDQDLRLGVGWLKDAAAARQFPLLSANVLGADGNPVFAPHLVKSACGSKIGIFSVMAATTDDGKPVLAGDPGYRVEDPVATAKKEVAALKGQGAEVIIALTHLGLTEDLNLADQVPGINLIFGAHSMSQLSEPQKKGSTWIFQSGYRGKHVGRVDLDLDGPMGTAIAGLADVSAQAKLEDRIKTYGERIDELKQRIANETDPDRKTMLSDQVDFYNEQIDEAKKDLPAPGAKSLMRNQLADLSRDVPDDPKVADLVDKATTLIAKMPPTETGTAAAEASTPPVTSPFVGVAGCQACHPDEYATWTHTDHAKAYKTLMDENHQMDFDCVPCHTTGYKKDGGPKDPYTVAGFIGVQCEQCHGAGRAHAADPKNVKLNVAFDEKTCRTCHSVEQTGDRFVFSDYLPKVDHGKSAKGKASNP